MIVMTKENMIKAIESKSAFAPSFANSDYEDVERLYKKEVLGETVSSDAAKDKFRVIDYSNWEDLNLFATGVREKKWLRNKTTGETGLFKFPKTEQTGDYWAEKLAYELCTPLGINIARTELGTYQGRTGSFSYNVVNQEEYLLEGYVIIGKVLSFSTDSDVYSRIGVNYNVELIEQVLQEKFIMFLDVFVFDCLIGNTDRHHGNWAFIIDDDRKWLRVSPFYDNGSSLCYLERDERIKLMQKDKRMLEAAIFTKARSQIGLGDVRPVDHFILFDYICSKYNLYLKELMQNLSDRIDEKSIDALLKRFDDNIISANMKVLLKLFVLQRKNKMIEIYNKYK